jgi:hypothetical protein
MEPKTMTVQSKAPTVFDHSNTKIAGCNPIWTVDGGPCAFLRSFP